VTDVLIFADTVRSPELRHEVPMVVGDPFLYAERDGERHIAVTSFEIPLLAEVGDYVLHPFDEFGLDELRRTSGSQWEATVEVVARAVRALGVEQARVPISFPLAIADRLRAAGVELTPDPELFDARRRVKSPAELAGIRRAQAAAEAGMKAVAAMLREAAPDGSGVLVLGGEPLTSERLREAVSAAFLSRDAAADVFVLAHGPQGAIGHHLGSGPILAGEPVVADLFPADKESGCFADMTRTFVVGEPTEEVTRWHAVCLEAMQRSLAAIRPGVTARSVYDVSCEVFEAAGYPTQRTKEPGTVLDRGFYHALGHGVGLEVHEEPTLNLLGHAPLVAGDVLAIEPGLYRPDVGGVRIEDLVLVTDDGFENLTSFPYGLAP
jgi:Xaa-Pro aminopeptidase